MVSVHNDATWVATGNNVRLSSEMARRVVPIRLEPGGGTPRGAERLQAYATIAVGCDHRAQLVSACLSLIKAWIDAGRPSGAKTLGSFERWASVLGGILENAGVEGFLRGRETLHATADYETEEWKALCAHWWTAHERNPVTAKDSSALAKQHTLVLWLWAGRKDRRTATPGTRPAGDARPSLRGLLSS